MLDAATAVGPRGHRPLNGGPLEGPLGLGTAGPFQQGQDGRHHYILPPAPGHGTEGICQNICNDNLKLGISVLTLSRIPEGGHLHQLFPNVNLDTAKYTSPCMLGSVYLTVSSLTLGGNCTRCTLQSSSLYPS